MTFVEWAESKTRRLSAVDLALVKWSCVAAGVLLADLVPSLRRVDPRVLAAITVALAIKPAVSVFSEKGAARAREAA